MKTAADTSRDGSGARTTASPGPRCQRHVRNPAWTRLALRPPSGDAAVDAGLRSPSRPLDAGIRSFAERRLGEDFGDVRVHTGDVAARSAAAINARAYTVGSDVVFGRGQFDTGSDSGRRLIAHELTHVAQQRGVAGMNPIGARVQRAPDTGKSYRCTSVSLVRRTLTFHGDQGDISVTAKGVSIPVGSYVVWAGREPGRLMIKAAGSTPALAGDQQVLTFSWDLKADTATITAFKEKVDGYVASLTSPVPLTVSATPAPQPQPRVKVIDEGGPATGSGGSGTGEGGGAGGTGTGAGAQQTGGSQGGGTGTTPGGTGTGKQGQGASGSGATGGAQGGQAIGEAYQQKLQALLDGPVDTALNADQVRELQAVLDKLSLADIALFKKASFKVTGGDIDGLLRSLRLFISTKAQYEKADLKAEKPEVSDESQKLLADAMKQYRDDMTQDEKERLARATIQSLSNRQLKNLTAGQVAESIVRIDKQVTGAGDEMSAGLDQALNDRGWGRVAGVARGVKGAAGFWGFLAFAAMIAAAFVPGLNVAVLAANALAAGMVAFAAASIQEEAEIKAAGGAKSAAEMEQRIERGATARTEKIVAGVVLALPVAGKYLGKLPGLTRLSGAIENARLRLRGTAAGKAFGDVKASVLESLGKARGDLQAGISEYRAGIALIIKRVRGVKGSDLVKELQSIPELQDMVPADTAKALQQLKPADLEIARGAVIDALDNAPAIVEQTAKALDADAAALEAQVKAATSPAELDRALGAGSPTAPQNLEAVGNKAAAEVVKKRVAEQTRSEKAAPGKTEPLPGDEPPAVKGPSAQLAKKFGQVIGDACSIGSITCRTKLPDHIEKEAGAYPTAANVPKPPGPYNVQKAVLAGVQRGTQLLRDIVLGDKSRWTPEFSKALAAAQAKGLEWPVDAAGNPWEVHHVKPVFMGGTNAPENLIPLPKATHQTYTNWWNAVHRAFKNRFTPDEWDEIYWSEKDVPGSRVRKTQVEK